MVAAVANALRAGRSRNMADRAKIEAELQSMLEAGNYEGLGWSVFDAAERLDPRVRGIIEEAITSFVRSGGPTSGDELTFLVSREVMRNFHRAFWWLSFRTWKWRTSVPTRCTSEAYGPATG